MLDVMSARSRARRGPRQPPLTSSVGGLVTYDGPDTSLLATSRFAAFIRSG
jgi:hypothetical protein